MSNVFFLKLARENNNGLSNQLLSLISGILYCIRTKKEMLIVDKFLTEINTNCYCSISQVFNLFEINTYLHKYNLKIADGFNINSTAFRPISWDVITLAKKQDNKRLLAFIDEIYSNLYFSKYLISHTINFISEKLNYESINVDMDINESNETNEIIYNNKKINVIHLRLENDGIEHWSNQNNMNPSVFKRLLTIKYIELIKENINKEHITVLLTGDTNNDVVQFMKENEYNVMFIDKKFSGNQPGRELNAIIDLIIGRYCNNVFIGCGGSTFSELLLKYIPDENDEGFVQKITFDLNNILA
jgi:DNA-dependent RNA polymerase auxiliary subunit epsilon